jgi:hypothetical protein
MAHKVPFIVTELGADVDPLVLHLFAALILTASQGFIGALFRSAWDLKICSAA